MNKKLMGWVLLAALVVTLGACQQGGGDSTPEGGESPAPTEEASPSPEAS